MSQGTGMQPAADETHRAPGAPRVRRLGTVVYDWLRNDLFRRTDSGPVGWRKIVAAVALFLLAMAISLGRTKGAGSLNTIWIEDAKFLLSQSLNMSAWGAISTPISTYYQEPARLITEFAIHFPLAWVPGIMALFSAAEYAMYGLVAYIASGPYLRSTWLRLLLAAPVCCIPLAYTQVNNDLVTVQFFGLFGAFWTCLWLPGTRAGKILSPLVMATVSYTAVLSIGLFPLVIARLVVDRSKTAWALAILWASGVYLQMSETISGKSHHDQYGSNGLTFVLHNYISRVVPRALFGERSLGGSGVDYRGDYAPLHVTNPTAHHALIICAWLIVLLVIALAAVRFTEPNWTLFIVAGLFSLGFFTEELLINVGVVQTRYTVAPALLLYTALIALLRPRQREAATATVRAGGWLPASRPTAASVLRWLPAAGFAVLLLVAVTLNFRVTNGRTTSPPWTGVVAAATSACTHPGVTAYTYVHEWWWVTIPCDRVR
jgi:hypothetical protein